MTTPDVDDSVQRGGRGDRLRLAAGGCIALGLVLEAIALADFRPGTFVGFVMVGGPLMVGGAAYFAMRTVSVVMRRGER